MKTKFKLGQDVLYWHNDTVAWGKLVTISANGECEIETYIGGEIIKVPEYYLAKNIFQMVRKVLGKKYIYWRVLADYLKNHYNKEKT